MQQLSSPQPSLPCARHALLYHRLAESITPMRSTSGPSAHGPNVSPSTPSILSSSPDCLAYGLNLTTSSSPTNNALHSVSFTVCDPCFCMRLHRTAPVANNVSTSIPRRSHSYPIHTDPCLLVNASLRPHVQSTHTSYLRRPSSRFADTTITFPSPLASRKLPSVRHSHQT